VITAPGIGLLPDGSEGAAEAAIGAQISANATTRASAILGKVLIP
jgi:hypothetical protein